MPAVAAAPWVLCCSAPSVNTEQVSQAYLIVLQSFPELVKAHQRYLYWLSLAKVVQQLLENVAELVAEKHSDKCVATA